MVASVKPLLDHVHTPEQGWPQKGGRGTVAPSSGNVSSPSEKNFVSVGEFSTKNCAQMHRKIPFILILSPLSGNPTPPRRTNPGATPAPEHHIGTYHMYRMKACDDLCGACINETFPCLYYFNFSVPKIGILRGV